MIPLLEKAHSLPLTETEKHILAYFENNLSSAIFMNLEDLSHTLFTSSATIVRFCKKLGLNGFNELKYQLKKEVSQSTPNSFLSDDLIKQSIATFKDNIESLQFHDIEEICRLLISERPLYIYGTGLSCTPARYLQNALTNLDRSCILIEFTDLLESITYDIKEDAILFVITTHGDALRYMQIFENAKQRGATVILITCKEDSPLHPYSTFSIVTNDKNKRYRNIDINSRIGILTIIQILIELIASKLPTKP